MSDVPAGPTVLPSAGSTRTGAPSRRPVPLSVALPSLVTAALVAVPIVYVFIRALDRGPTHYLEVLRESDTTGLLIRTVGLVFGVVAASVLLSLPMAWLVTRSNLPLRRLWTLLGAAPLLFPSYISAFAVVTVLGPRGQLQRLLGRVMGIEALPDLAYGFTGALIALTLFTYPYVYLLLIAAMRQLDPSLEEASRLLSRSRLETFIRVELPQLRPALYGGGLLITLYTLSDFGAVSIVRFNTFTLAIYNAYRGLFDRTVAAALATILIAVTLVFIAAEVWLLRSVRTQRATPHRMRQPVDLGRWRTPALILLALQALLATGVPLWTIGEWTLRGLTSGAGSRLPLPVIGNSLLVALAAAVGTVVLSVAPAIWTSRHPSRTGVAVERVAAAGHALPGIVIALSLVFVTTRLLPVLYQSLALLVIAYVIRFLPEAIAAVRSSLLLVPAQLEEAGRTLGRSMWRVVLTVTIPLVKPGILAGAALVFLTTMKELPATLILRPIGFETLATRVWSTAAEGFYGETGLPALLLVIASLVPVYFFIVRPVLEDRQSELRPE